MHADAPAPGWHADGTRAQGKPSSSPTTSTTYVMATIMKATVIARQGRVQPGQELCQDLAAFKPVCYQIRHMSHSALPSAMAAGTIFLVN